MSLVTLGLGVGALVTGGLGGSLGAPPPPPPPLPHVANVYPVAGGGGGSPLPGDIEFGEHPFWELDDAPQAAVGARAARFFASRGVYLGATRTAGCADAGKAHETWASDSEPRGAPGETAGCADAGKVHDDWKVKP